MRSRVSIRSKFPDFDEISYQYAISVKSLSLFYSPINPEYYSEFQFYTNIEIEIEKEERLKELENTSSMMLLASIEALFHVDYLRRCYYRKRDALSRAFRELYRRKHTQISLEDELLELWKRNSNVTASLVGQIRGAFRYRHWLAHGRYWEPKLGQAYDFESVHNLARAIDNSFPFER
ncbi:MAG: hypothetical protein F4Y03_14080 [Alphaproteobacteria bacterium]|nr:hypothetical protein [Alphaproteobacteria bacterium]